MGNGQWTYGAGLELNFNFNVILYQLPFNKFPWAEARSIRISRGFPCTHISNILVHFYWISAFVSMYFWSSFFLSIFFSFVFGWNGNGSSSKTFITYWRLSAPNALTPPAPRRDLCPHITVSSSIWLAQWKLTKQDLARFFVWLSKAELVFHNC